MPSRRGLPTLSIFSRNSAPPSTSSPQPSPKRTSLPPLTPPARLHLRNLLPTSPEGMPTPPLPPRQPYSWLWQCHSCNTVYKIGCTRRCLVCSHEYCISAGPPKVTRGKKRRRNSGMCASEFDYSGWAEWGAWRRKVLGFESAGRIGERQREQAFCNRTHNCVIDCDYPSECHHERYRLQTEAIERSMREEPESLEQPEEPHSPSFDTRRALNTDDKLPLNEAVELREAKDDLEEQKSPTSPKSPLSQTSFFWDEPESKEEDENEWWVDGERKEKKSKTKSQQKIEQLTGLGLINPDGTSFLEADGSGIDNDKLYTLIEEDESMMPLDIVRDTPTRRCKSRFSCRERLKNRRRLNARNPADADKWEDWEDSSDSESEGSSLLSSSSSCSSLDAEPALGNEAATATASEVTRGESGGRVEDEVESGIDREIDELVKAGKSFLRD